MIVSHNGHLYPIVSKNVRTSLGNSGRYSKNKRNEKGEVEVRKYKDEPSKHYVKITTEDDIIELANEYKETCFILQEDVLEERFKDLLVDRNEYYQHKYKANHMVEIYFQNKNKLVWNQDYENVIQVCEHLDIEFTNQSLMEIAHSLLQQVSEKVNPLACFSSTFNNKVFDTIRNDLPCANWVKTYKRTPVFENVKAFDFNKLYSSIISDSTMNWLSLNITSTIEPYTGRISEHALYYVNAPSHMLFQGPGWYFHNVVKVGLDDKLITRADIKYQILGNLYISLMEKKFLERFVNHVYEVLPAKLAKTMLNPFIGNLGKTHTSVGKTKWTTSMDHAFSTMFQSSDNEEFVFSEYHKDKQVYKISNVRIQELENIQLLIQRQVVQTGWLKVYELIKQLGGDLVAVKTDCVIIENPIEENINVSNERGGYKYETITEASLRRTFDTTGNVKTEKQFDMALKKLTQVNIDDEYDTQDIVNKIIECKNVFLSGRAGCGKSYITNKLIEALDERGIKYKIGAPTHVAKRILGDKSKTVHQLFGHDILGKVHTVKFAGNETLIIDEVSMVNMSFWRELIKLRRKYPNMSFILCGDFNQLPPVEEEHIDIYNSEFFRDIVDYEINLKVNKRCTEDGVKHFNMMTQAINGDTLVHEFPVDNGDITKHLCYTNKTRKQINRRLMLKYKKDKDSIRFGINRFHSRTRGKAQTLHMYSGLPIICKKNFLGKGGLHLINGDQLIVKEVSKTEIKAEKVFDQEIVNIPVNEDFAYDFYPAYALTIHSCQGQTINDKYCLHETERYTNKMLYVALSRTTDLNLIHLV